ncbi:MAG: MFS transporter [Coriobacteriales bacterium]|jgi:MFS family permease|nr:MFS transporter [Coriobacteriales bacterium]
MSRGRYQNAVLVGLVVLLVGLSVSCIQYKVPTIMTTIAPDWGLTSDASSWLMSIFTLVGIFVSLPAGGLAQRFGFKPMMLVSSGIIILGSVLGLLSGHNGIVLIVSRAVEGIALTFITACAPIAIQQCVRPEKIGTAMGLWGCWGNGGAVIAALLTPQIFGLAGFTGVWVVFAVFAAVAAVVFGLLVKQPRLGNLSAGTAPDADPQQPEAAAKLAVSSPAAGAFASSPAASSPAAKPRYSELAKKDVALYLTGFVVLNIIMLAMLGMLPSVLMLPEKGFSMELAGFASTLASLLALVSTPLAGIIADRMGRIKPLLLGTFAVLGPCLLLMYTQTGALFWAGAVLLGAVGFGSVGLFIAGWMQVVPRPELVPLAMGVLTFVQCLGQFLGTFLVSLLLGPDLGNWLVTGIALCAFGFAGVGAVALVRFR